MGGSATMTEDKGGDGRVGLGQSVKGLDLCLGGIKEQISLTALLKLNSINLQWYQSIEL